MSPDRIEYMYELLNLLPSPPTVESFVLTFNGVDYLKPLYERVGRLPESEVEFGSETGRFDWTADQIPTSVVLAPSFSKPELVFQSRKLSIALPKDEETQRASNCDGNDCQNSGQPGRWCSVSLRCRFELLDRQLAGAKPTCPFCV